MSIEMDLRVNLTNTMQKVYVEYALILMGLRTGTYTFVYIYILIQKKFSFFFPEIIHS